MQLILLQVKTLLLMGVGRLSNMKVGAIIQARMKSTRLPGKILMPLPFSGGDPLIVWPINRLRQSKFIEKIIIATSTNKENEILNKIAEDNAIFFYSGSEENVLSRFVEASNIHELDVVVRITADNPIIDDALIDELIQLHIKGDFDYSYSTNLPVGMNIEVVKTAALKAVYNRNDLIQADEEHVTYFFKRQNLFSVLKHEFKTDINKDLRLTVDYPADYAMLNVVAQVSKNENLFGVELIKAISNSHKWIFDINSHHQQKKQYHSLNEEIKDSFDLLRIHEFKFTLDFLENRINKF